MVPMNRTAAATYVQISRDELEGWLDAIGYRGKWKRDPRFAGVYLIALADNVAVKLSSTIGSSDDAMGRGKASMQLSLVSTATGRVVNKKAQGQDHFKRTTGWKKTWEAGIDTMRKAYLSSSDFYDAIALIEDRDKYQADLLAIIEAVPGWGSDAELVGYHRKLDRGGVLMLRELKYVRDAKDRPAQPEPVRPEPVRPEPVEQRPSRGVPDNQEERLAALRELWKRANQRGDMWTMDFTKSIAQGFVAKGRKLSGPQLRIVVDKLNQYRVQGSNGSPASELFSMT